MEIRVQFHLTGRLQGVGFRPFVYRLALEVGLAGWVKNTAQGVEIEIQGRSDEINQFESSLVAGMPELAQLRSLQKTVVPIQDKDRFRIVLSETTGGRTADILPDVAVCALCINEVLEDENRRYLYPFTHCTDCGPRYSILNQLPYDRRNTTMDSFKMCELCLEEYNDPLNRRFHAQTNCCPDCGPILALKDCNGRIVEEKNSALLSAVDAIRRGAIVAVQGLGGFHLFCDAVNDEAVRKLRRVKARNTKPFALMVRDLSQAHELCEISKFEEKLLQGKGAPIVLLKRSSNLSVKISSEVAPGLSMLGLILPYTPLHILILRELQNPVIATSGNIAEEPICYELTEAFVRLKGIADLFLVHNRLIASRADDSVVREIAGTEVVFRAGRGYAPWVIQPLSSTPNEETIIALGGHQKNTISIGHEGRVVLMPHTGNLESVDTTEAYLGSVKAARRILGLTHPKIQWVSDLHPNYRSTQIGKSFDPSLLQLQHHKAHLLSCVAEHCIRGPIFGVAWDGTGYGFDDSIWGGEFFRGTEQGLSRIATLRPFRLVGGSVAVKEIRRSALGLLYEIFGDKIFLEGQILGFEERALKNLVKALKQNIHSPVTSSMGRVFDAVAALVGLRGFSDYEGQAALELELSVHTESGFESYPVRIEGGDFLMVDWEPWIFGILNDRKQGVAVGQIAAKFHRTLARVIVMIARHFGIPQVVLSGGCFQNRVLCEWVIEELRDEGFYPFWNQRVPPNDGGISVGQVIGGWNVSVCSR